MFVGRLLRLAPLYFIVLIALFFTVAVLSDFNLNIPLIRLAKTAFSWINFGFFDRPDINKIKDTSLIVAGVTWTLPYEWFFYFSLPALAAAIKLPVSRPYLILSSLALIKAITSNADFIHGYSFLFGIIAAVIVKNPNIRLKLNQKIFSVFALALLTLSLISFSSAFTLISISLLGITFTIIASGNSLFGLLTFSVSRFIGEITYSIYLLHGLLLFFLFRFYFSFALPASALTYWLSVFSLIPILILISYFSFHLLETPAMRQTAVLTLWLRTRIEARRQRQLASITTDPHQISSECSIKKPSRITVRLGLINALGLQRVNNGFTHSRSAHFGGAFGIDIRRAQTLI